MSLVSEKISDFTTIKTFYSKYRSRKPNLNRHLTPKPFSALFSNAKTSIELIFRVAFSGKFI